MKNLLALICAAIPLAVASGMKTTTTMAEDDVRLALLRRSLKLQDRELLSANCTTGSAAIAEDPTLVALVTELQNTILGLSFESLCTGLGTAEKAECKLDMDSYLPDNFAATCEAAGGEVVTGSIYLDCGDFSWDITSDDCISNECTDEDKAELAGDTNKALADGLAQSIGGSGVTCTSTAEIDGETDTAEVSAGVRVHVYSTAIRLFSIGVATNAFFF